MEGLRGGGRAEVEGWEWGIDRGRRHEVLLLLENLTDDAID